MVFVDVSKDKGAIIMDLVINKVSKKELNEFSSILKEAAFWLKNEGMEMWTEKQVSTEELLKNNAIEEMFLGYLNNESAAAIIMKTEDDLFWTEVNKGESLFLHKLAVRRKYAGRGLAEQMIRWSEARAKRLNKKYLRLDCASDRAGLCAFYESQGFKKVREELMFGKYPTVFYELVIN